MELNDLATYNKVVVLGEISTISEDKSLFNTYNKP